MGKADMLRLGGQSIPSSVSLEVHCEGFICGHQEIVPAGIPWDVHFEIIVCAWLWGLKNAKPQEKEVLYHCVNSRKMHWF